MNTYVLWIQMDEAKIFKIKMNGPEIKTLKRKEIKHHTSRDPKNHKNCERFFHEVAQALDDADEILVAGPSLAKEHFQAHLERHHHEILSKCVIGTMTLDLTSDARLMEHSRKFFKYYDLFGEPAEAV